MSQGHPTKERRKSPCGDNCVKDDFNQLKGKIEGGGSWQTWGLRMLFAVLIIGNGWFANASNNTDNIQDNRLTAVETNQANILKNQEEQKQLTQQLIKLSTDTNLLIQTHIAREKQ